MRAFIYKMHAGKETARAFSDDCHARVTAPLTELWSWYPRPRVIRELYNEWCAVVLRIMRDARVWRTVRAIAANLAMHDGLAAQEAADVLVALYAHEPDVVWTHPGIVHCMVSRDIVVAGGVDVLRKYTRLTGCVWQSSQTWDRITHIINRLPSYARYCKLADGMFGMLLLGFERLQERGEIAVAHVMMLEDMLELVPLELLHESGFDDAV